MTSASQVRQKLLENSLECVKECQANFGGQPELATADHPCVQQLCKQIELILNHGIRDRDTSLGLAVIRNVRDLVGGADLDSKNLWSMVKCVLNSSEHQRFLLLTQINTDQGRGRAWIRASLNEQSLERFFNEILRDKSRLKELYDEWAFMRDEERSVLLPSMAAGLASVRFALQIDDGSLNGEQEKVPQAITNSISSIIPLFKQETSSSQPAASSSNPEIAQGGAQSKHVQINPKFRAKAKKKKLKATAQVVSFDDNLTSSSTRATEVAEEAIQDVVYAANVPPISPFSTQSASGDDSFLFNKSSHESKFAVGGSQLRKEASYSSIFSNKSEMSGGDGDFNYPESANTSSNSTEESTVRTLKNTAERTTGSTNYQGDIANSNNSLRLNFDTISLEGRKKEEMDEDPFDIYNQSTTVKTPGNKTTADFKSTPLTPVTNKDVGVLFPVHPEEKTSRHSLDLDGLENGGLDYAPVPSSTLSLLSSGQSGNDNMDSGQARLSVSNSDNISTVSAESNRSTSSLGKDDLRKALLSVMEKKEELEHQLKSMRLALDEEIQSHRNLKSDYDVLNNQNQEQKDKLESRNAILTRENELLKHQLKKYVGAVQKLRDGSQAYETLARLESHNETKEINSKYVDYHFEASEYEKKLIQVAEMHGELFEFNEMLQKSVQTKDQLIHRLRSELVLLRGPLPEDQENWETSSMSSSEVSSVTGNPRILVNIWIPSVFLTGSGSSRHHVYQVYIRIQDTEWNVYRRYNQFLDLHQQTKKQDPVVATFQFPPKKAMGNRSERFVENRRKQLQSYLRSIVNYLVSTNETMANCPDKETLISLMPFFSDAPPPEAMGGGGGSRHSLLGGRLSSDSSSSSRIVL